ncbi:Centrosome-associated protein CEP250 [Cocos nucifera]|uniref:Centrosome-associated protein CEP250 n=1 Tax=Cocos nucifera TaxID=13894 RepID=A0A8K0I140_COCNU|nr:Centrosome-associated protein CEP250 [Cocos nucifera]
MRRQGQYADPGINPMVAAEMQQLSAHRLQQNSGMNHFPGRADSLRTEEEPQYVSSKSERQWQWDRDGPKGSNQPSSHMYKEGQGSDASRSLYEGQRSDSKIGLEKQAIRDPRAQARQEEMETGFEDNTLPQTFEGLEQKFLHDIMKLSKEHQDAEDAENARHRERLSEINAQYQEKLLAVRARQATHREEFLLKESQARHQQYQQANMSSYQNSAGPSEAYGYGTAAAAGNAYGDAHRAYAASHFDPYGERSEFMGSARGHGFEPRGQYPGGRAYNMGGRHF